MKLFRISAFFLALSVATAPYLSFIGHAVTHLIASGHEHAGEETAAPHHHDHHAGHHLLALTPLPAGIIASNVKVEPAAKIVYESTPVIQSEKLKDSEGAESSPGEAPPPRLEPFISLLLHPTNAPPLR
jgi:hypothetical protein